jgi:hypothetical protein
MEANMTTEHRKKKYGTSCSVSVTDVPEDYGGMFCEWHLNSRGETVYEQQYWVFGKGYWRKWMGSVVYHRNKRMGEFSEVKERLRKALKTG